jgi:DNA repair protein RecN (Recombination protein N)
MLRGLEIESFGLIARAEVEFAEGATIFTGETGSGKTMLLGALDFALGARAGPDLVRRGARKALVTLLFDPGEGLRERLDADGLGLDPGEMGTIAREMTEAGRSSVRVNGRPSTAAYAREIGEEIAEIIGQREALRLLSPAYHLELLDRFAGGSAVGLREAVTAAYARVQESAATLARLTQDERHARERYDDARFTAREIEDARVEPGEIERLTERHGYLENVERIAITLQSAREALASEDAGATGALGAAAVALSTVGKFDAELREMAERASALQSEAVELATAVAGALEATEFDSAEVEAINSRLDLLGRLRRKYGGDLDEVARQAQLARDTIDEFESRDQRIAECKAELAVANRELREAATSLSALRKDAAAALCKRVVREFGDIALGSARFEVAFEPLERIGSLGAERVEFLFAANAGEPARPLTRVASGGELSRVLLALVVALAGALNARAALVFDEIDVGIGGATATAVGARIGELARRGQVVCVTHLAQLATWADRHYVLDKTERKSETTIAVRAIRGAKEREVEIARMLSGDTRDPALRHARALLVAKESGES